MPEVAKPVATAEQTPKLNVPAAPSVRRGELVHYQNNYDPDPNPAIVTHVWVNEKERLVNLTIFDRDGEARAAVKVWRGASVGTWRPAGESQ